MFKWFEGFAENQFRKFVRDMLIANYAEFEEIEGVLPHSTVETAYKAAWIQIGKPAHNKAPSYYREECIRAGEYVMQFYTAAMQMMAAEHTAQAE
jgi:hypothetical protein